MQPICLVLNAGSSSLKFSCFQLQENVPQALYTGKVVDWDQQPLFTICNQSTEIIHQVHLAKEDFQPEPQTTALNLVLEWIKQQDVILQAAGHRVVHGGVDFIEPVIITDNILDQLQALNPLAPLHQPYNLAAIFALKELYPDLCQVACFDTAFHAHQPEIASLFALPEYITPTPLKRYGFHGLSYEYINHVLPHYLNKQLNEDKVIVAHLGHGASMCAIKQGKSIASTMSFTALDGLPMGTRCGNLDPGVILYLLNENKMELTELADLLYKKSGLLGVSQLSDDVRVLLKSTSPKAKKAIDLFIYRVIRELGSLTAALNGLECLVFTAGIGEHIPYIRQQVCQQAAWLGIEIDLKANAENCIKISTTNSKVTVLVIPTNEEWMIAWHTFNLKSATVRCTP